MSIPLVWRRWRRLSWSRRFLLVEAAFWLVAAKWAIVLVRFPLIARYIGPLHAADDSRSVPGNNRTVAREISWAINRAAWLVPLRIVCLPRALAAWHMLHLRGIRSRVHCGASPDPERATLITHAWVDVCGFEITGYPEAHDCVEIGFFSR